MTATTHHTTRYSHHLWLSDYQTPGNNGDMPGPTDVDDPNVPPIGDPDKEGPGKRPGDSPDNDIRLPDDTDKDLTEDFPDPDDHRPGRRDENIVEDEEMYDD